MPGGLPRATVAVDSAPAGQAEREETFVERYPNISGHGIIGDLQTAAPGTRVPALGMRMRNVTGAWVTGAAGGPLPCR